VLGARLGCALARHARPAVALVCAVLGGCTGEQFQKATSCQRARWSKSRWREPGSGADRDGTPSTVATLNGEVFYYISQRSERMVAFMNQKSSTSGSSRSISTRTPGAAARQLRPAGRQDIRLHQPHHADIGQELSYLTRCSSCSASSELRLKPTRVWICGSDRRLMTTALASN